MQIAYFGYGSLVNRRTLAPESRSTPGQLQGWIREWRVRGSAGGSSGACALTVRPQEGVSIKGVLVREPLSGLAALDLREQRYDRVDGIGPDFLADAKAGVRESDVFLYRAKEIHYGWGDEAHPILQSYIDCVLAGYHSYWGIAGIEHFLQTTEGWHAPILADRHQPRYPRAVVLEPGLAGTIDEALKTLGVTFIEVEER